MRHIDILLLKCFGQNAYLIAIGCIIFNIFDFIIVIGFAIIALQWVEAGRASSKSQIWKDSSLMVASNKKSRLRKLRLAPRIVKRSPAGSQPGELQSSMIEPPGSVKLTLMCYDATELSEPKISILQEVVPLISQTGDQVHWLHIAGRTSAAFLNELGKIFNLHKLALEDVLDDHQRAKSEIYDDMLYVVCAHALSGEPLKTEQFNIFLGRHFIVTIQASEHDPFAPVRDRIRKSQGRIRHLGNPYLGYAILDTIIDGYFPILNIYGDHIDRVETRLIEAGPSDDLVHEIYAVKSELMVLRRNIVAHREMLNIMTRTNDDSFFDQMDLYLRDCLDHALQQLDLINTYREMTTELTDLNFSLANVKANEVMKVFTVNTAIFIPLTFITGIYGMNFDPTLPGNMPELRMAYAYPILLAVMTILGTSLFLLFKKKKWL